MTKFLFSFCISALLVTAAFAQTDVVTRHKINPNSEATDRVGFSLATGGTSSTTPLLPHTGPVINPPTVYLIWYGNWNQTNGTDTPAGQQIVRDWAANIGGSSYFAINSSYSTSKPISGSVFYGGEYTNTGTKTRLGDRDIGSIVDGSVGFGKLPYNASGVYFVITSSNISETSGFCSQYCGWHTDGNVTAGHVRYAFVGNAARCLSACAAQTTSPNGNAGVDGAVSVLSHELEEATTDPDLNAWYDSSGAENGDKCAWTFGHHQYQVGNGSWANIHLGSRDFLIQRNLWYSGSGWFCMMNSTSN